MDQFRTKGGGEQGLQPPFGAGNIAVSLPACDVLCKLQLRSVDHRLVKMLWGQGYDGASNMSGEFNGLKALILKRNPYARYIYCFAHQLQLEIVVVAKNNRIRYSGKFDTKMENYQFVFVMYLIRHLLGITNELSLALQEKDQIIVQAMRLIEVVRARLQDFRKTGWESFLEEVRYFCEENSIPIPNMKDNMQIRGRSRQERQVITHFHHYRGEIFCEVIDLIAQEMQNHFPEASMELLLLMSCLDPIATASVERVFSVMNVVKTDLRNKMGDEWMNDSLVVYIEREVFATIDNEVILQRFQKMQTQRMQLPPLSGIPRISSIDAGIGSSSSIHR
ncbi:uncharacterized protein LOC120281199 [Dioscorea cayenensis subsp. rotundata]|uniref:Uncharacterized protein LOC120281199 n=1 Tax=Dioscorea cayennensis subsp. rotundata TaxID=55577 RepID=A0AB40CVI4_DIOCR|nr:uncharacterized protein LOC120281199 [Dioscorea cayenensis subsp. rotundata]